MVAACQVLWYCSVRGHTNWSIPVRNILTAHRSRPLLRASLPCLKGGTYMSFRMIRRAGLAAIAAVTLAAGAVPAMAHNAMAQPTTPTALAMAADAASSLVTSRPAALHASANDAFLQQRAISGAAGLSYVPYERT